MKNKPGVVNTFRVAVVSLLLVLLCIFAVLWVRMELRRFEAESVALRETALVEEKAVIREDVEHILQYIAYKQSTTGRMVRDAVRSRTDQAVESIAFLHEKYKNSSSLDDVKAAAADMLRAASWDNGKGYYFVVDTAGRMIVNRHAPELEGRDARDLKDGHGEYPIRKILEAALSDREGGFCSYHWDKPGAPDTREPKISFVLLFEPLGWIIGNGMYLREKEGAVQREVLRWLKEAHPGEESYYFVGTWEGVSLLGPAVGKNMWEVTDANGVKIVQELVRKAREGAGFVEYLMPAFAGYSPVKKISYAAGIPEWQWYVGTGVDIDYIDEAIAVKHRELENRIRRFGIQCVFTLGVLLVTAFAWVWFFSRKLQRDLSLFLDFFSRSADEAVIIPLNKASYREFDALAVSANTMAEERQRAWDTLKENQNYLEAIFNAPSEAIVIHSAEDGSVLDVNQAMLDMYGVAYGEALAPLEKVVFFSDPPYSSREAMGKIEQVKAEGPLTVEWLVKKKDGTPFWVEVSLTLAEIGTGRFIIAVHRDIDAKKKAEQVLAAEQERLAVTLRSIADAVITTDTHGKVLLINKAAEKITGWAREEALGRPLQDIFRIVPDKNGDEGPGEALPVEFLDLLAEGKEAPLIEQERLVTRDGRRLLVAGQGAPLYDKESELIGSVLVFRDITREKKNEQELLKVRKLESVGVLAGGIAHDFNNILSAVLGNVELAERLVDSGHKAERLLEKARDATLRASKLTKQLLTFAEGGDPVKEVTALPQVIEESALFVLHGSPVSCRFDFADDLWLVDIDPGQMGEVIRNIILNARHAMPAGGLVDISGSNIMAADVVEQVPGIGEGAYVRISIRDYGEGMEEGIIDRIFDPYFTTREEAGGLGLAVCHSVVTKHKGYITVDSSPGEGTVFTLYLPRAKKQHPPAETIPGPEQAAGRATVMIMDDEEMVREVAGAQLEHLGYKVVHAADGDEAVRLFAEMRGRGENVDVIIMDLTIPGGKGGKEAVKELLEIDPGAKVVVASGYSTDPVMADYGRYGFSAALAKPLVFEELKKVIASTVGRPSR